MILAIDFDGTCVEHAFPAVGKEMPYAVIVLKELVEAGHKLILWTCRENHPTDDKRKFLDHAVAWFEEHGIKLHSVNCTAVEDEFRDILPGTTIRKAYAQIYIDDRNLGGFPGWLFVRQAILGEQA